MKKTKTIVIGEVNPSVKGPVVEFHSVLVDNATIEGTVSSPSQYLFIELVCLNYGKYDRHGDSFDLMFAYNDPKDRWEGSLFLGKWNHGIVG